MSYARSAVSLNNLFETNHPLQDQIHIRLFCGRTFCIHSFLSFTIDAVSLNNQLTNRLSVDPIHFECAWPFVW
jgi:hypothetical protein